MRWFCDPMDVAAERSPSKSEAGSDFKRRTKARFARSAADRSEDAALIQEATLD